MQLQTTSLGEWQERQTETTLMQKEVERQRSEATRQRLEQQRAMSWKARGLKLAPSPNARLLSIEESVRAEAEGKKSKPYKNYYWNVVYRYGQTSGRYTVVVPTDVIKLDVEGATYYYGVPEEEMHELIYGMTAFAQQAGDNTRGVLVAYGYALRAAGKIAEFGGPLSRSMASVLSKSGEGMLYDVRKAEAQRQGYDFDEPEPSIGFETLAEIPSNIVGGSVGDKVGKVTKSAFLGTAAGTYASGVITKGYQAVRGEQDWASVFEPPDPWQVIDSTIEGKIAGHFHEGWVHGRKPRAPVDQPGVSPHVTAREERHGTDEPSATSSPHSEPHDKAPASGSPHEIEVTERGIELCSPKPCPLLEVVYAKELKQHPTLKTLLAEINQRRAADPKDAKARRESQRLEERLGELKARATIIDSIPEPALKQRARGILETGIGLDRAQLESLAEWSVWRKSREHRQRALVEIEKMALSADARRNAARLEQRVDRDIDRQVDEALAENPTAAKSQPSAKAADAGAGVSSAGTAGSSQEPLVAVRIQGDPKSKGSYWQEGTPEFELYRDKPAFHVMPKSEADALGLRPSGTPPGTAIEPVKIKGMQVESSGAGRGKGKKHKIMARTSVKADPDSTSKAWGKTIGASRAEAHGYKYLLESGEFGIMRPGNVSTGGVDAITAEISGGKAKIFLNDFTGPETSKGEKPTHKDWVSELDEALKVEGKGDDFGFGNRDIDDAIQRAAASGDNIYVRIVRIAYTVDGVQVTVGTPMRVSGK